MRNRFLLLVSIAWLSHLVPAMATGATIYVPGDFLTIQAAIDDAGTVAGDEVVVAPGTYAEAIDFLEPIS